MLVDLEHKLFPSSQTDGNQCLRLAQIPIQYLWSLALFSWILNVDGAAFWLLLHRCQDTLLTVDNKSQWCFVLSKPCALCGVRFLSVCLYDSP